MRGVRLSQPAGVDMAEDACPGVCSCRCGRAAGPGGVGPRGRGCGRCAPALAGHVSLCAPGAPPGEWVQGSWLREQPRPVSASPWVTPGVRMGVTAHTFMPVSVLVRGGGDWQKSKSRGGGEGKGRLTPSPNARRPCSGADV